MIIDDPLILRLETLAKLKLEPSEKESLKKDLNSIIAMLDKLKEVDTEGVEPLIYVNENNLRRDDVANVTITNDEALQNAPDREGPFIKVPKVLNV